VDADGALAACEKLRAAVADNPVEGGERRLALTISVGWANWEGEEPDELLARADAALYRAKEAGRDQVCGAPPGERLPV